MAYAGNPGFSENHGPDLGVGSLFGLRTWSVTYDALTDDAYLTGSYGTVWRDATLDAECDAGHERPPVRSCGCGIWAYWRGHEHVTSRVVTGVVEAWGRCLIGERGFRAQHARIRALTAGSSKFTEPPPPMPRCPLKPVSPSISAVLGPFWGPVPDLSIDAVIARQDAWDSAVWQAAADYLHGVAKWERDAIPRYTGALETWRERKRAHELRPAALGRYGVPVFGSAEEMLAEFPVPDRYDG
jgi:hypothetical protein